VNITASNHSVFTLHALLYLKTLQTGSQGPVRP
jgi:hypothetical protein